MNVRQRLSSMNSNSGTAVKREVKTESKTRTSRTQRTSEKTNLQDNPIYQIMEQPNVGLEVKRQNLVSELTFTDKNSIEKINQLNAYKEHLQELIKIDAEAIIDLTDSNTMSMLKDVIESMEGDLIEFEELIDPIVSMVSAISRLRVGDENGSRTGDIFREIIEDREKSESNKEEVAKLNSALYNLRSANVELESTNQFVFFGGPSKDARATIQENDDLIAKHEERLEELKSNCYDTKYPEFVKEKEHLRALLDISSDGHREKHEQLISVAKRFISNSDEKVGTVLTSFENLDGVFDRLSDSNFDKSTKYSVIADAIGETHQHNIDKYKEIEQMPEETSSDRLTKDEQIRIYNNYNAKLSTSETKTVQDAARLTESRIKINAMKDTAIAQKEDAMTIKSSGISGVANMLALTLQSVSAAAIGESNASANSVLARMEQKTGSIVDDALIQGALRLDENNAKLVEEITKLTDLSSKISEVTDISREAIDNLRNNKDALSDTADQLRDIIVENESLPSENVA